MTSFFVDYNDNVLITEIKLDSSFPSSKFQTERFFSALSLRRFMSQQ